MSEKVILYRTSTNLDAQLIAAHLRLYGIESELPDEYAFDVAPFLSSNKNFVRILVDPENAPRAKEILIDLGYEFKEENKVDNKEFSINIWTSNIRILRKFPPFTRLTLLVCIVLVPLFTFVYFATKKSDSEIIIETKWCVQSFLLNGKKIKKTSSEEIIVLHYRGKCFKEMRFSNLDISIPGYGGPHGYGYTIIKDSKLTIYPSLDRIVENMDDNLFFGSYEYELESDALTLKGDGKKIIMHKVFPNFSY